MGIHEPNFKVVFDYRSPVRALFELHMEIPLGEAKTADPAEVERVKQLGLTLAGHLDRDEWGKAAEFLSRYADKPIGKDVIEAVFALKSSKPAS